MIYSPAFRFAARKPTGAKLALNIPRLGHPRSTSRCPAHPRSALSSPVTASSFAGDRNVFKGSKTKLRRECPLWVESRHCSGVNQTYADRSARLLGHLELHRPAGLLLKDHDAPLDAACRHV